MTWLTVTDGACVMVTDVQKRQTYSLSDVFQTIPMQFEGEYLEAPANYDLLLRSPYGDYLELPKDIKSHFEHVSHDESWLGVRLVETQTLRESLSIT